jgi:uncharacterized membrane protein YjjP (DUF1212 family)
VAAQNEGAQLQSLKSVGLVLLSLMAGYGFYKMNNGDWINSIFFTIGILGITFSVMRNSKTPQP